MSAGRKKGISQEKIRERNKKIIELYQEGLPTTKIAKKIGGEVNRGIVEYVIYRKPMEGDEEGRTPAQIYGFRGHSGYKLDSSNPKENYWYKSKAVLIDKGIYKIELAEEGAVRYQVSVGNATKRFKTYQEAEDYFYTYTELNDEDRYNDKYPFDLIEDIFNSEGDTVMFDDMNYVISHFDENFVKVCSEVLRDQRERDMISLRYKKGLTLEEIGKKYSLTRERVRQILNYILKKLRMSKVVYEYLNRGFRTCLIEKEIINLENELNVRKRLLENELNEVKCSSPDGINDDVTLKEDAFYRMSVDKLNDPKFKLKHRVISRLTWYLDMRTFKDLYDFIESHQGYDDLMKLRGFGVDCLKNVKSTMKRLYGYKYEANHNKN